jgi:hypothetical protein
LIQHNWLVLAFTALALWAALRLYLRPARATAVLLYGALLLVVAYEYQKHGVPMAVGTVTYLFSVERNPLARQVSQWLVVEALPVLLYGLGLALLVAGWLADRPTAAAVAAYPPERGVIRS